MTPNDAQVKEPVSLWGKCLIHKCPLRIRYCSNGKSYVYCQKCVKERNWQSREMLNLPKETT